MEKNPLPFLYGRIAESKEFTDRQEERKILETNFLGNVNTILISPRRWGKSSLVKKAATAAARKNKTLKVCFVNLQNIRSEEEFYVYYATEIIKATSTKIEELMQTTREFLGRMVPKISLGIDPQSDFSLSLDWQELKKSPDEILNLSEKIADKKGLKILICLDEFQNISEFSDPMAFQKKLRTHWQNHRKTTYCIYGSKRHMMMEVFTSPSMPFYKFGALMFLEKISKQNWVKFIVKRFRETGKSIDPENAALIATLVQCHPYYVQQLAQLSWLRTKDKCTKQIIINVHESLAAQLSLLFQQITDGLSNTQVNFLRALSDEVKQLSSSKTLDKYTLGTSGNVSRIKEALVSKEIIDIRNSQITFLDPLYRFWLQKSFFK